ncbi:MAG TPA: hypothetical protein VK281_21365, partial [Xanthobacteraceae bacterium]|nr:hypothetical protein [Xanthobacteraceae bacterium]
WAYFSHCATRRLHISGEMLFSAASYPSRVIPESRRFWRGFEHDALDGAYFASPSMSIGAAPSEAAL